MQIITGQLHADDITNYALIRKMLGVTAELPDGIIALYEAMHHAVLPHLQTNQQQFAAALIVGQCMKHLTVGANNLFCGYSGPMFRETRAAVEAAAIACRVYHNHAAFKVFIDDREHNAKARKAARDQTGTKLLFPLAGHPMLKQLQEHYDYASMRAHTNVMGFVSQMTTDIPGETSRIGMQDFTADKLQSNLPLTVLWLCFCHIDILATAKLVIFTGLSADFSAFDDMMNRALTICMSIYAKHQRYIEAHPFPHRPVASGA
ncbi:MAG TPA: hypothetical protein VN737_07465 [Bryobacteraceae bacterium]|nr:hypothetical protein [Bryobacteraceae bacterium]